MKNKFQIQSKILSQKDINVATRIFLYFLVTKYLVLKDNNLLLDNKEVELILGFD